MRTRILTAITAAATAAVLLVASPAMAAGCTTTVASLGDSFASGEGGVEIGLYLAGSDTATDQCHRSTTSAVELLAYRRGWRVNNVTCSGATTADIVSTSRYGEAPQATQIQHGTAKVFITIGGNDIGFGTLAGCIIQTDCDQTPVPGAVLAAIQVALGPQLDAAYAAIEVAAPYAQKVVELYPPLTPPNGTADLSRCPEFNANEVLLGNQITTSLNAKVRERALAHKFTVVNPASRFVGGDLCSATPKFYRPGTVPAAATYHPNLPGRVSLMWALAAKV